MHIFKYTGDSTSVRFITVGDVTIQLDGKTGVVLDIIGAVDPNDSQLTGDALPPNLLVPSKLASFDFQKLPSIIVERMVVVDGKDYYTIDQWQKRANELVSDSAEELGKIFIAIGQTILDTGVSDFPSLMSEPRHFALLRSKLCYLGVSEDRLSSIFK